MKSPFWMTRVLLLFAALTAGLIATPSARAQNDDDTLDQDALVDDMVGQTATSWTTWKAAMRALERDRAADAEKLLGQIAEMKLSDLRLALMADRSGIIRMEQVAETADASETVKALMEKIRNGRKQKQLAEDGWHLAAVGRFKMADATFKALDQTSPDPVALVELARMNPNRHLTLVKLVANAEVGPSAKRMIELLNEGEKQLRMDPYEIATNVTKLGGTPREVYNATIALKNSGEYAIPELLEALQDPQRRELHPAVIQVLPTIGRGGLNPMVQSLTGNDPVSKQVVISALAQIGYKQAIPYLAKLSADENTPADVKAAANQSMSQLGGGANRDVSALFYELGDAYYKNHESLSADSNADTANVWYMVEGKLKYIPVPTPIFNDIMAMRCAEESLKANAGNTESVALWLAGNFRRESKLGMDVESDEADVLAAKDGTRPDGYPRSIYFARAAGPMYNHRVLGRAVTDTDPGVALGAIAALAATAGQPSLLGAENIKQPLVQALSFPNKQVRFKTAIAIGRALPESQFSQAQNVVPVLAEALGSSTKAGAMVVDPDENSRLKLQTLFRANGMDVAVGTSLFNAQSDGDKNGIPNYDVILLATDINGPELQGAIDEIRRNFKTAATPIVVIMKPQQTGLAQTAARMNKGVAYVESEVVNMGDPEQIKTRVMDKVNAAARSLGMAPLNADLALNLAMQAADVLRMILDANRKVFDAGKAAPALIKALEHPSEALRIKSAAALALIPAGEGQAALAEAGLNDKNTKTFRVAAFNSLAEAARRNGNLVGGDLVQKVIDLTMAEKDLVLQAAASKALGALDLTSNKASEIIRTQSRG